MKKLMILIGICFIFNSCKKMNADYKERLEGVKQVCPNCTFVMSEMQYYACDTSKQPNIVYKVYFRSGGLFYKASDVDHLVRIN